MYFGEEDKKLNDDAELLKEEHVSLREKSAELLDAELGDDEDPLALIVGDLKRLDIRLKELEQAIEERQNRLDAIEQDLGLVRLVRDYLNLEQKKQVLETIQESDLFKQLEATRDQVAQLVEDAEAIKNAVAEVARDEAETRLASAGETIDKYFRQLSRNPAVQQLKLAVTADKRTRRNSYDITDHDGEDLTPILSQGDLNALALAIFLGLATAAKEGSTFRFLMLDDPSPSSSRHRASRRCQRRPRARKRRYVEQRPHQRKRIPANRPGRERQRSPLGVRVRAEAVKQPKLSPGRSSIRTRPALAFLERPYTG